MLAHNLRNVINHFRLIQIIGTHIAIHQVLPAFINLYEN